MRFGRSWVLAVLPKLGRGTTRMRLGRFEILVMPPISMSDNGIET